MPAYVLLKTAGFGPGKAGLATVGYSVGGGPRTTVGVEDVGGGSYAALVRFEAAAALAWDTGDDDPEAAADALDPGDVTPGVPDFGKALAGLFARSVAVRDALPGGVRNRQVPPSPSYPCATFAASEPQDGESRDDLRCDVVLSCLAGTDAEAGRAGAAAGDYLLRASSRVQLAFWRSGACWLESGVRAVGQPSVRPSYAAPDARDLWRHERRYEFRFAALPGGPAPW